MAERTHGSDMMVKRMQHPVVWTNEENPFACSVDERRSPTLPKHKLKPKPK